MAFDSVNIEKSMYTHPTKSFSQILEELDPSAEYGGTELEGLDAFGRQLKRFNIKVSGKGSDCVNKFFSTAASSALFPEYVSRAVRQGVEEANVLPQIVATTTVIDSLDYRTITSIPADSDKELATVGEGALIPQTVIKAQENLVKLNKRGRMLVASYEALKFQRIDLFTVTLKQIGAYIARCQLKDAIDVLIGGDGNGNPAGVITSGTEGAVTYGDLLNLVSALHPHDMTTLIMSPATMLKVMQLDEFKNPLTGINFAGTGKPGNPLGANIIKSTACPDNKIIGLDSASALEMVVANDISLDYDKLIDRQLERAAITTTSGFAKIFADASAVLSV